MIKISLISFAMLAVITALAGLPGVSFGQSLGVSGRAFSAGLHETFSQPQDADSGVLYGGVQIRAGLKPKIKIEGSIDYRRNDFNKTTKVHVYPFQASIMAYLNPYKVVSPFLLGGIGWYYTQIEGPFNYSYTTNRFGIHAGAGLETMLTDTLSLDGSYRYIWVEKFNSKDVTAINRDYEDSGYTVSVGLNLYYY